jgi:hypothetical protein
MDKWDDMAIIKRRLNEIDQDMARLKKWHDETDKDSIIYKMYAKEKQKWKWLKRYRKVKRMQENAKEA